MRSTYKLNCKLPSFRTNYSIAKRNKKLLATETCRQELFVALRYSKKSGRFTVAFHTTNYSVEGASLDGLRIAHATKKQQRTGGIVADRADEWMIDANRQQLLRHFDS